MRIAPVLAPCGVLLAALCGVLLAALCGVLLAPGPASAGIRECERLGRNIERYESMADRAGGLGNPMWEERMRSQAEALEGRREERCTEAEMVLSTTECQDMTRQIEHYEEMAARAAELGNTAWDEATRQHIEQVKEERSERCPEWSQAAVTNRAIMRMLKTAGELALTYFTMGYF
jgi:hypothetical protein